MIAYYKAGLKIINVITEQACLLIKGTGSWSYWSHVAACKLPNLGAVIIMSNKGTMKTWGDQFKETSRET